MITKTFGVAGAALAMLAFGAGAAHAQQNEQRANLSVPTSGYTYFNRPGATIIEHDADIRGCVVALAGMPQVVAYQSGVLPALIAGAQGEARFQINVENCMVVRGWRVMRLDRNIGRALDRMPREELSVQLATVVGAEEPIGDVVRTFDNEAARSSTIWGAIPNTPQNALSLKSVDLSTQTPPPIDPLYNEFGPLKATVALDEAALAALPAGTTLAVVRIVGNGQTNGEGFTFLRMPRAGDPLAGGVGDVFHAAVKWTLVKGPARERREFLAAFPVTPGRWRLGPKMNTLDFCFGAPATEIREGEVVFLGTFALASRELGPIMDLEPARALLADNPALAARVRPAEWVNGVTSPCSAPYSYAIEVPGAPFEPGYVGGSAPQP